MKPSAAETVIERHGEKLAHTLAYQCMATAKEIVDTLSPGRILPGRVDLAGVGLAILALRAAVDLMGITNSFGERAHDLMLDTMDRYYTAQGLVTVSGGFKLQVAAALETIRRTPDPRDWVRAHSVALLGTRDPEDEPFHLALASGFTIGSPLVREIESLL